MTSDATSSASGDEDGRSVVPATSRSGGTGPPRPWYLRRATLVGAVVVAFVAVAVISDLPTRSSHAQQVSDAKSFVTEAYRYMDSCNAGLTEAFNLESEVASGTLSPGDMVRVPDLLRDDNLACSYTNDDVFQLASMTIPRSLADSNKFATALLSWIVPDAYGATKAIAVLAAHPRNPAASVQLRHFDARLTHDRDTASSALAAMNSQLGMQLPPLRLVRVPAGAPPLADG